MRPEIPASTNNITIKCYSPDMKYRLKFYGKLLPAQNTFMFHYVDAKTGESTITCHS